LKTEVRSNKMSSSHQLSYGNLLVTRSGLHNV